VGTLRAHLSSDVLKDLLLLAIPGHNKLLKQVLEEDLPLDLLVVLPMLPSSALKNPVAARATSIVIADRLKDEASQRLAWQMATSWHGSLNELVAAVELTAPLQGSE
jgi:CRISPR/Cas system CMR subunit Cmr6 (Cas7 group RAMP superfamily)